MAIVSEVFGFDSGIRSAFARTRAAIATARARRAAIQQTWSELESLNDRELNDLGISRADIPHIARTAVR